MWSNYQRLRFEQSGPVLTVYLSSPAARNAVDGIMHAELARVFRDIAEDETVRVVILTGDPAGGAFCAGGNIEWISAEAKTGEGFERVYRHGQAIVNDLAGLPQPIIAMVNGAAIGLGATLALFCDVIFMAEAAKIADPHVGIGVVAGDGGAVIWPLLVGPNRAKEYLMTGDPLTAAEAERIGLINHVVPAAELPERVYAFADKLARGPQSAIRFTKRAVNLVIQQLASTVVPASLAMEGVTFNTADHREAARAFDARETPKFS